MARDASLKKLVDRVLSDPSLYPDDMKSWLQRFTSGNPQVKLEDFQLPTVDATQKPSYQNGWVDHGAGSEPGGYYKDPFGRVHLSGLVGAGTALTTIFTLPSGFRPSATLSFVVLTGTPNQLGVVDVHADGQVAHAYGAADYTQLNGISFRSA